MIIKVCPEDMILEYSLKRLQGEQDPLYANRKYLKKLPEEPELSEEFAAEWHELCLKAITRLVGDSFGMRTFMFEENGRIKRYSPTDEEFWQRASIALSHRGPQRVYQLMHSHIGKNTPDWLIAKPGDALIISLMIRDFSLYSMPWLATNNAGWLITSLFIRHSICNVDEIHWLDLLKTPEKVDLPLRDLLIEESADYLLKTTNYFQGLIDRASQLQTQDNEYSEFMPDNYLYSRVRFGLESNINDLTTTLIASLEKAVEYWCNEGATSLEDERYIRGAVAAAGIQQLAATCSTTINDFKELNKMQEAIHESFSRNNPAS